MAIIIELICFWYLNLKHPTVIPQVSFNYLLFTEKPISKYNDALSQQSSTKLN